VTALGKLFRTTAFKLSFAYLTIFALGAGLVLGRLGWNVKNLLDAQIRQTIQAESEGLLEQYDAGSLHRLTKVINARARQPGSSLYLLTNYAGEPITGNVAALPEAVLGRSDIVETRYERVGEPHEDHLALVRVMQLSGGFRLLVGRDLDEREELRGVVVHALVTSLIYVAVIGLIGGLFVASRVLRRIDGMTATTQTIMAGDLSGRLPVSGTGDELDRLAQNLNAMLERITELMTRVKEVSDNIAHDLKTPLTRLRNRAEMALSGARDPIRDRQVLESIIEDSDGLIRIFNALLLIARAEAGSGREGMGEFDVGEVTRDVADLYEPLAEEAGACFSVDVEPGLSIYGNRELIGQALVNLVDNALKYGVPRQSPPAVRETEPEPELALATEALPRGNGAIPPAPPVQAELFKAEVRVGARRVDGRVEIAVADHGSGIPPQDRARASERFVRLEHSRSQPGSGLGLSLAAAVAHLHGGELRIEDNFPGLRVVIALPARDPGFPVPRRLPPPPAGVSG
jgi:signal transduction histidine kinase